MKLLSKICRIRGLLRDVAISNIIRIWCLCLAICWFCMFRSAYRGDGD